MAAAEGRVSAATTASSSFSFRHLKRKKKKQHHPHPKLQAAQPVPPPPPPPPSDQDNNDDGDDERTWLDTRPSGSSAVDYTFLTQTLDAYKNVEHVHVTEATVKGSFRAWTRQAMALPPTCRRLQVLLNEWLSC